MRKVIMVIFLCLGFAGFGLHAQTHRLFTIDGQIRDKASGELLAGATLFVKELSDGTISNAYGFYSLSLPAGRYHLQFSYIGYQNKMIYINLKSDTSLAISLNVLQNQLNEVEIKGSSIPKNISNPIMSVHKMSMNNIMKIPSFLGEVDLIKALQLLPGVKLVAEGSSGFSVRGGASDQNLILLDEATVYNAGHLMGFFSVFSSNAVKSVTIYKGDLPPAYGGRLSSLVDVRMKEGNTQSFHGSGGIGLISTRLMLEGPIQKDKSSFMVSGRRTYADLFLKLSHDEKLRSNRLYFYDLNTKLNFFINKNNHIFLSGYFGKDVFKNDLFQMNWGNATGTLRWNHLFGKKLFANTSFVVNRFNYTLGLAENNPRSFVWKSSLTDLNLHSNFDWFLNKDNKLNFGFSIIYHDFFPGKVKGTGQESVIDEYRLPDNFALESAFYFGNNQKITPQISLKYGFRISVFNNIGPATIFNYDTIFQVTDSTVYNTKGVFHTYRAFEPRTGIVFRLNKNESIKASYARNVQYIQKAQNSTAGNPLDIWFQANPNIKPQTADQLALGYYLNFINNHFGASLETYYKWINHAIDFKDHANLLLNKYIDGELRTGKGYSYGLEFMLKKKQGKFTGWLSYTYSRSFHHIAGINGGKKYPAPYDRPNDISVVLNYNINSQFSMGMTWIYLTGQPVTFPVSRFEYGGSVIPVYSSRNAYRLADYHRLDVVLNWKLKQKKGKKFRQSLNFSIYNVYNRKNTWVINFENDPDIPNTTFAEKTYLFGILPTITYNFHF